MFTTIAMYIYGGTLALGIIGPSLVQIGNIAPVQPVSVYYPAIPGNDTVGIIKDFGIRAHSVLRALSNIEAAKIMVRSKVQIANDDKHSNRNGSGPVHRLTYSYSLTGFNFGLQQESDLALAANGSCTAE